MKGRHSRHRFSHWNNTGTFPCWWRTTKPPDRILPLLYYLLFLLPRSLSYFNATLIYFSKVKQSKKNVKSILFLVGRTLQFATETLSDRQHSSQKSFGLWRTKTISAPFLFQSPLHAKLINLIWAVFANNTVYSWLAKKFPFISCYYNVPSSREKDIGLLAFDT